jgi:DNA-binding transcriptional LysR family regulator
MNPHHLELFYHVAKAKGISRAVRQMPYGIQQPSVSAQVNALERDLGVTLYERRPFKLTPAGEELFKHVEPFFGKMTEVRQRLRGAAQIRIGASPIVFRDYLPPVLDAVKRKCPELNMILRALNQPELIEAVELGELDVVISLIPDKLGPGLRAVEIIELPLILLLPKTSALKSVKDLWANEKVVDPLISLKPNELICQVFQQTLARLGVSWLPRIEMDSLDLIEKYVETGFGIGLSVRVPQKKFSSTIRVVELPDFSPVRLGAIYREQSDSEPKVRRTFLEEVSRQAERFSQK